MHYKGIGNSPLQINFFFFYPFSQKTAANVVVLRVHTNSGCFLSETSTYLSALLFPKKLRLTRYELRKQKTSEGEKGTMT